jgi:hypothetical protein
MRDGTCRNHVKQRCRLADQGALRFTTARVAEKAGIRIEIGVYAGAIGGALHACPTMPGKYKMTPCHSSQT